MQHEDEDVKMKNVVTTMGHQDVKVKNVSVVMVAVAKLSIQTYEYCNELDCDAVVDSAVPNEIRATVATPSLTNIQYNPRRKHLSDPTHYTWPTRN
ncbi:hypothetical protein E2C01_000309 [Portunus trituberculatus]|uniref:Uncharacterized protein n=1 Tax=Portunus trituberculatus TaxID=210409 RepID=A0A5B7CDR3_PORTR|nr:hypothetical protein [Portunus trituberculatus]